MFTKISEIYTNFFINGISIEIIYIGQTIQVPIENTTDYTIAMKIMSLLVENET
jgi:hypothetical protein